MFQSSSRTSQRYLSRHICCVLRESQIDGLYALIGAIVGYLAVLEFGLSYSIIRYVARYRARNDREGEQKFLALAMITYVGISLLVVLVGAIIYWNLDNIFGASFTVAELSEARIMSAILVFNLALLLPGGAFEAVITGYQRFSFLMICRTRPFCASDGALDSPSLSWGQGRCNNCT